LGQPHAYYKPPDWHADKGFEVKRPKNNDGQRRRLPKEAMLARDAAVWAMHLRGMTPTEIGDELGLPRQTAQRSLERSERLHANDGTLEHLQACFENEGSGEPEDDPNLTPDQNGRVWDEWVSTLTVADVERIARAPHPALTLDRLKWRAVNAFLADDGQLLHPPDVMQAINVAWGALPSGPPDDDESDAVPWREGVAKARGE